MMHPRSGALRARALRSEIPSISRTQRSAHLRTWPQLATGAQERDRSETRAEDEENQCSQL
eukprot:11801914-Alexandrium_andersonii.AAC.1